jgi:hypothetical protein
VPEYSPRFRTAVLLCGAGTAGVYQAGVLKALHEAGIKIDLLAGHGPGAANALGAAIDGGARLWDPSGPWASAALARAYRWRGALRVFWAGLALAAIALLSPLLVMLVAAAFYAAGMLASLMNMTDVSLWLVGVYQRTIEILFDPPILPTIVPRSVVLALFIVMGVLVISAVRALMQEKSRRRLVGGFWWRLIGAPLSTEEPGQVLTSAVWTMVRGASEAPAPEYGDIGRRYVEVLTDNLGQPGFREVLIGVHDLDGRRDLVGAVLAPGGRGRFEPRRRAGGPREAETVDFTGPQRDLVIDFVMGAVRLPVATAPWPIVFAADSYWRGERHHLCDRPELGLRLLDEAANVGAEQIVLVSPAPLPAAPHGLRSRPADLRSRIGDSVRSVETAAFDDLCQAALDRFRGVFVVRPSHNPIGPFDFGGVYDDASDRRATLPELMEQGYHDAYRCFIEPVVAAGERVET